jgi:peptidoglycan hydrolase-like protein with peptidoglycan-binding domain
MREKTLKALQQFQSDQGLSVTGKIDKATMAALRESTKAATTLPPSEQRPTAKESPSSAPAAY